MSGNKVVEASLEDYEYLAELGAGSAEDGLSLVISERQKIFGIAEKLGLTKYINIGNVIAKIRSRL
jgi:hypothetical protein